MSENKNKIISRNIINDEINFDDNKSKAELVYEIRQWKMLLKENYNVRKGETVAIGILDVNHLHLTSIIACAWSVLVPFVSVVCPAAWTSHLGAGGSELCTRVP